MQVRVYYPLRAGRLALRAEPDWERDLAPVRTDHARGRFDFELPATRPFAYFKPVLVNGSGEPRWAQGDDYLALAGSAPLAIHPHFDPDQSCHVCEVHRVPSTFEERGYDARVFLPPGYDENTLARYPVLYMQDGQNLFFPDEAFAGKHWRVAETLAALESMNLIRRVIVVGVFPRAREEQYTAPGYDEYGRFLVEELKPWVDGHYRTRPGPRDTAVLGSSLGGVVSLHLAWRWPEVFGQAGCMSSTFGYRDDLLERVQREEKRPIRVYLDSGWPRDNFEATRSMFTALRRKGFREGHDLLYLAFPDGRHEEQSWAARAHVPFQIFFRR